MLALVSGSLSGPAVVLAEGDYTPYDQGVRHVATLAGYLCYGLMALTVCFGILATTGWARRSVTRQGLSSAHMVLAVMTLTFGVLHGIAYVFQTGQRFSYVMAVVPFAGGGEFEVGLGIIGLELGIAVAVSIWVQRRMGYRRWHLFHYLAYGAFGLSLAHTIATSPEVRSLGGVGIIVAAAAGACVLMTVLRMLPATTAVATRVVAREV